MSKGEQRSAVVECTTWDPRVDSLRLTTATQLCPFKNKTLYPLLSAG